MELHNSSNICCEFFLGMVAKIEKGKFYALILQIKKLLHSFLIYNINYFILCKKKEHVLSKSKETSFDSIIMIIILHQKQA
jgi:hypothetical protein